MSFQVYNSLTRKKQPFEPIDAGQVRMYNCGPTVYGRAHIGNLRSFLFADTLRRWLEHEGLEVKQVMNITDVGHITADADQGEDKLDAQARKEGRDPWKISEQHTEEFLADLAALDFLEASIYPRATAHIEEMLEMIDGLLEKGHAYRAGDNVYFDVSSFAEYGKLSGNKVEDLAAGARIDVLEEKRAPADFALWKSDPAHLMKWESHFGPHGFPGWHIECSAMARTHLGDRIDIHTGGEDNIFPHHECEIAQSEAFTGEPFANYWMHAKFLQVDGGKMSKSLGNVYTLSDVESRGFRPRDLRFTLLRGHYRQPLNFTWAIMADSARALAKLDDLVTRLKRIADGQEGAAEATAGEDLVRAAKQAFRAAMNDDLNTPPAIAQLFGLRDHAVQECLGSAAAALALEFLAGVQGALGILDMQEESLDQETQDIFNERIRARENKEWARSDKLRDELLERGIVVEDTGGRTVWRKR
ncbi:MAG: cysteine--tRNA ligase [bacterium]|jgi:cysteinyl-tRNA synthetase|nr:cysteine--tRNA ligase [Planctomycetota bacterium]HIL51235.1 cysteine--tRNA ligase [Planctomycetota bacterium]